MENRSCSVCGEEVKGVHPWVNSGLPWTFFACEKDIPKAREKLRLRVEAERPEVERLARQAK
jgi:hypothetical protein